MTRIRLEYHGHVAYITLDHPPANTWTLASLQAFLQMMVELDSRPDVVALVIRGAGDKFFCAGADLNMFVEGNVELAREVAEAFGKAFEALARFHGVSIAAINGYAMGGGLEVALACDIRIAETQAQMALPEAKVGLLPCAGGTQNLAILVGEGWAKRMILCGERLTAEKALQIGLVEEVVGTGMALEAALLLADKVAEQSPPAVAACKQLIQKGRSAPVQSALPLERELFVKLFDTKDQVEGVQAFLQKRKASWING